MTTFPQSPSGQASCGAINKRYMKRKNSDIAGLAIIAIFYIFLEAFGITCPIKYLTGISCAGCGMSRAWLALLHGDISRAWHFHPLFFTPPIMLLLLTLKNKLNRQFFCISIFIIVLLYVIVYLCRLLNGNGDIVVFDPQNGLIGRGLRAAVRFLQTEV